MINDEVAFKKEINTDVKSNNYVKALIRHIPTSDIVGAAVAHSGDVSSSMASIASHSPNRKL